MFLSIYALSVVFAHELLLSVHRYVDSLNFAEDNADEQQNSAVSSADFAILAD
jgi:hypothetical protein